MSDKKQELLNSPPCFGEVRVVHLSFFWGVFLLCVYVLLSCLIYVICVCLRIVVSNTYCVVCLFCLSWSCVPYVVLCVCFVCLGLVYPMLPVSLDCCPFLIAPSVFSNVYLLVIS